MGSVRTKNIKNVAFDLYEAYPDKFNNDFENNKKILDELKLANSKHQRNKIAGYMVRVVKKRSRKE
mgnify:CR=1 FL=1